MKQQEKLNSLIKDLTLDTLPRSLLLLGEYGCGKRTLVKDISSKLNIQIEDITEELSLETIDRINSSVFPTIYTIDSTKITVKEENVILKFLEEPLNNAYIILLCENKNQLIDTIINRTVVWSFEKYSKEFLSEFLDEKDSREILNICETPGQIIELKSYNIDEMLSLANDIFEKIKYANLPNALSLENRFAFKDEKNKLNIDIFSKVLLYVITNRVREETDYKLYHAYVMTDDLVNGLQRRYANKRLVFDDYIINLRRLFREDEV